MSSFIIEMKRAFRRKELTIAISIGIVLVLLQFFSMGGLTTDPTLIDYGDFDHPMMNITVVHNFWIGGELNSFYASIYWILLPMIIALPFATSYYEDRHYGRIKNILTRRKSSQYYLSIWLVNFFVSGFVAILPFFFSMLLHLTNGTWTMPIMETSTFEVGYQSSKLMFYLFYNNIGLYYLIYLINLFIIMGLLSNIGMSSIVLVDKNYIPLFTPFLIWMSSDLFSMLYPGKVMSIKGYLNPVAGGIHLKSSILLILVLFIVSILPLVFQYRYKEDF